MLFSVPKEPFLHLIDFTIDGVSYQAEDGMTWRQWVKSPYNTKQFKIYVDGMGIERVYVTSNRVIELPVDTVISSGINYISHAAEIT